LISRFSEDIDLAVSRSFFNLPDSTPQQLTAIRRKAFHYIEETLVDELRTILSEQEMVDFDVEFITENSSAMAVVVGVKYKSVLPTIIEYVKPVVKIEFSAMSLDEPWEAKEMSSLINSIYPEIDTEINCSFRTVLPERTFLEKVFLLHEEYQKDNPRTTRMSRHLYDLEKMMDTDFARSALANAGLYQTVVAHRRKFNNIPGIEYDTHRPASILICPPDNLTTAWRKDYDDLRESFIYETGPKTFDELSARLQELTKRIKVIQTGD
jgi:hypothetical protein